MLLRHVAFCDGDEAGHARFGCQQIVKRVVVTTFTYVVSNRENFAFRIEQEFEVHLVKDLLAGLCDFAKPG